jgi:hypothetical protein
MEAIPIKNYEEIYSIYSDGRIYNVKRKKFLKYYKPNLDNREWIGLSKNGKRIIYEKNYLMNEHYGDKRVYTYIKNYL